MPTAQPDLVATTPGAPLVIRPLANDSGSGLVVLSATTPSAGSVLINPDQSLTYTPDAGFSGSDSFVYTLRDSAGVTASAMVTVTVARANRAPATRPDEVSTLAGVAVLVDPLANDSDPDQDLLRLTTFTMPSAGRLEMVDSRRIRYTPSTGFVGADGFTYTAGDGRGGATTGVVRIEVLPQNRAPVAQGDAVTAVADTPVTFNPLANDSDPDGEAVSLVGLTVPLHGRVMINADRSLTYIADAGYVGADEIIYTLRDASGATALGRVTLTVNPQPVPTTYANGYRYRRRLVVPAGTVTGTAVEGLVMLANLEGSWLRSKAQGGKVESTAGFDLRFELENGTRLPHDSESYDGVAGRLIAWVRLPALPPTGLRFFVYYGKAGLNVGESSPEAVWFDHLAVWHFRDGRDAGPAGRTLSLSGTAARSGPTGPALSFDETSIARLDDATFLNGLSAFTLDLWINSDREDTDHGPLYVGPLGGQDGEGGLIVRQEAIGTKGREPRCWAVVMAHADGRTRLESEGDTAGKGARHLVVTWASGDAPVLYLDGDPAEPSYSFGFARTGPTALANGPLLIGSGGLGRGFDGAIDEVRFRGTAVPAQRLAIEHASQSDPDAFYGVGGEDTFGDTTQAPVAIPLAATTRSDQAVDVDVLASAYDPGGTGGLSLSVFTAPTSGSASVVAGKLHYTPATGFTGADSLVASVSTGTKSSRARIMVDVLPRGGGSTQPLPPGFTWKVLAEDETFWLTPAILQAKRDIMRDGTYVWRRLSIVDAPGLSSGKAVLHEVKEAGEIVNPIGHLAKSIDMRNDQADAFMLRLEHFVERHSGIAGKLWSLSGGRMWIGDQFSFDDVDVYGRDGWTLNVMKPQHGNKQNRYGCFASDRRGRNSGTENYFSHYGIGVDKETHYFGTDWKLGETVGAGPVGEWVTVEATMIRNPQGSESTYTVRANGKVYSKANKVNPFFYGASECKRIEAFIRYMNGGTPKELPSLFPCKDYTRNVQLIAGYRS